MTSERPPDPLVKLRAIVDAFPGAGYAVVDGGHFPDLPAAFRRERLFARSLFLDKADPEVQAAGPWLVALGQAPDATDKVFALVGEKPAAVFWCCEAGETALWRHLRGLNVARIPTWAAEGHDRPTDESVAQFTSVMFRHWDPSVLGALMPVLGEEQFTRTLGPATHIAFHAADFGGARTINVDAEWPRPVPGPMTIQSDQIASLNERRVAASRENISDYLHDVAASEIGDATRSQVLEHVRLSEVSGRSLGIVTEAGHSRWSLLMLLTNGKIFEHEQACAFIRQPGGTPDAHVKELMARTIDSMRRDH